MASPFQTYAASVATVTHDLRRRDGGCWRVGQERFAMHTDLSAGSQSNKFPFCLVQTLIHGLDNSFLKVNANDMCTTVDSRR
jgi:hypothetical protein